MSANELPHVQSNMTMLRTVHRARRRTLPPNPPPTADLVIAESFENVGGEPWIAIDDVVNGKRLLAFAALSAIQLLAEVTVL